METRDSPAGAGGAVLRGLLWATAWGAVFGAVETGARLAYYRFFLEEGRLSVPDYGALDALGSVVLAAVTMAVVGFVLGLIGLLALSPVLAVVARGKDLRWRASFAPVAAVVGGALFLHLYWFSRFFVDFAYSEPWNSPKRLALGVALAIVGMIAGVFAARRIAANAATKLWPAAASLVLLAAVAIGFSFRERQKAERASAATPGANIVLFIVDALRADHLHAYGYPRATSPRIDELAAQGVVFERAIAQAPYTWTSFGSIFTGKYPRKHGLLKMDPAQRFDPRQNLTVQRVLDDHGYATGAFMTGMISNASGLLDGFTTYFESTVGRDPVHRGSVWSYFRSEMVAHALWNKLRRALDSAIVSNEAIEWLEAHARDRFLLVVHLYSTHTPYEPMRKFDVFSTPGASDLDRFTTDHAHAIETGQWKPTAADVQRITDLYDGGVLQADAQIGAVVDELTRLEILDDSIVVVTGYHGEAFGENGPFWEHDWMFNSNLHVPLVLRLPKQRGAGVRVAVPVELVDFAPTVLDLVGAPPLPEADGESLASWARGEQPRTDDFAFCENTRYESVQNREWKLVRLRVPSHEDPPRLYHLASDPGERRNVAKSKPEALAMMTAALDEWARRLPAWILSTTSDQGSAEQRELLKQGGYMAGDRPTEGTSAINEDAQQKAGKPR